MLRKLRLRCVGIEPLTGFPHQTKRLEERYLQFRHAGHAVTKHLGTKPLRDKALRDKALRDKALRALRDKALYQDDFLKRLGVF